MSDYPEDWAHSDPDGAVAALVAGGVEVIATDLETKNVRTIEFLLDGRRCRLTERRPERRREWLALDFPWPAAWPDIALTAAGEPSEPEVADPTPPPGHALCSHDLPAARAVVDAGFAAASVSPRATLEIEEFDGAAINTGSRVTLNAATANWLLNLLRLALAAAPPAVPGDDVRAETFPEWEDSSGLVQGTRVDVVHRLLWLIRMEHEAGDPSPAEEQPLLQALDQWVGQAAELAGRHRAGALDAPTGRDAVRQLVLRIADAVHHQRAEDSRLVEQLQGVVAQARAWDTPAGQLGG